MNWTGFEPLATTVLYEGHLLYPYRASAEKNRHRWTMGTLFPPGVAGEPDSLRLEILIESVERPRGAVKLCFLRGETVEQIQCGLDAARTFVAGPIAGWMEANVVSLEAGLWRLEAEAGNGTQGAGDERDAALQFAMASAQLRCALEAGQFVSAQDPPPARTEAAQACRCRGVYPVLVGHPGEASLLLAAPLILEDYARVAPQSAGDFCDATEMDELLTLRVLTLTAQEQEEIRAAGGTGREILERCGRLAPQGPDLALHGGRADTFTGPAPRAVAAPWDPFALPPEAVPCGNGELRVGHRVRLHPRPGADLFSSLLLEKTARIQAIEQDMEGEVHLAVVVEDDPGADMGYARQSGHRFFFSLSEVEPL
ncbi:MAG: hypothetical protein ACRD1Y_05260 [Terriglobales bacterium]